MLAGNSQISRNSAHRQWGAHEKSMWGKAAWRLACFHSSVFACCAVYSDPSARGQRLQESILNETFELRLNRRRNPRVVAEKHAEFDVPFVRGLREVGGSDECRDPIHENAFCMLAGRSPRRFLRTARVVEHRRLPAPRPVIFPERPSVLFDGGVIAWRDIQDQDDFEFRTDRPGFLEGEKNFVAVEDAVRGDPK